MELFNIYFVEKLSQHFEWKRCLKFNQFYQFHKIVLKMEHNLHIKYLRE